MKKLFGVLAVLLVLTCLLTTSVFAVETSGQCGDDVYWEFEEATGTLTISGSGDMEDYTLSPGPWYSFGNKLKVVNITEGVTSIGRVAFALCDGISEVTLPRSLDYIGQAAFSGCTNLCAIDIPNSVSNIGVSAFDSCSSLSRVSLPSNLRAIPNGTFSHCVSLCEITIPDTVTFIGGGAFSGCSMLGELIIPSSVTEIADGAFRDCAGLEYIELPNSLTVINKNTFRECVSLAEVIIPDTVTSIDSYAFYNCDSLSTIDIPDSVTFIGEYAFMSSGLKEISLSNSIGSIATGTFRWCTNLETIVLPNSIASIGQYAFNNTALVSIDIPDSVIHIGNSAFSSCEKLKTIKLSENLTSVGEYAFAECTNLTEIVIPPNVSSIGADAFYNCKQLTAVYLPESLLEIGSRCFNDCKRLYDLYYAGNEYQWNAIDGSDHVDYVLNNLGTTMHFNEYTPVLPPDRTCGESAQWDFDEAGEILTISGTGAMYDYVSNYDLANTAPWKDYADRIKSVVVSDGITSIGSDAFKWCYELNSVVIPNSVISIGARAFAYTALTEITIPDSVNSIGDSAFSTCTSLSKITIPNSVISIGDGAFLNDDALETVIYGGTQAQWDTILIGEENDSLLNANIFYNDPTLEPVENPFTDVNEVDWFYNSVMWAVENNVTGGKTATTFAPYEGCTRAQVVTFLWAANGKPEPQSMDNPFTDVAEDAWYLKPVLWAVENGITNGISETEFGPENTCTRAQIVTFLYAAVNKPEVSGSSTFIDVADDAWYLKPVLWAAENGVTGGIGDGMFGSDNTCTRCQVVTFLYKVYGDK